MPRIQVQRDEYHQTIANKIRDLREYSVQEYERALSTKWDPKALSREVEAAMPESPLAGAIQSSDLDAIGDHRSELVYKALDVLKTDYDAYKALRVLQQRVDSYYQYLDSLESPRDIEEEYADYESNARALEADATKGVLDVLNGAIDRSAGFSSDVVLEPQGSEDSWDKPPRTYQVSLGKSSYAPSFTLFLKDDGSVDSVEDILEGGDDDFFKDPKQQYDYFNLVNEIRKPGSTSKGKVLRLYTARPIKDRSRYESATTVPINIFMASTFEEAHGLATDLGGSEQRDVWKVSIDSRYLVQTLEGSVKHYQTVGEGRQVPVKSIELVSPGHRQGADRKAFRITDQRKDSGIWRVLELDGGNLALTTTDPHGLLSGNPATKVLDLDPYAEGHQTRYPSLTQRSKSYTIPYGSSSFAGEPKKLFQLLKDLIRLRVIDNTWTLTNSPHYRNKTVGDVLVSPVVDTVDVITQKSSGEAVFYHGTSSTRWAIIKSKGLVPGSAHGFDPKEYTDYIPGYSDKNVYLTTSIPEAEKYATRAAIVDHTKAVVLKVIVRDFTKFVTDEDFGVLSDADRQKIPNSEGWRSVSMRGWYSFQDEQGLWGSGDWTKTPMSQMIRDLFQSKVFNGLRKNKTVAYRGRIPASDIKVYEEYKPVSIKGEKKYDYETADKDSFADSMKRVRENMKVYAKRANLSWVGSLIAIDLEEVEGRPMISMSTTVGTPKIRLDEMDKLVSINRVRGWDVQKSQSKPGHVSWVIDSVDFDRVRSFCGSLLRYVDAYAEKLMPVASRVSSARSCHMRKKANSHTLEWRDENCLMSIWEEESKDMVRLFIRTRDKNLRLDELDEVLDFLRRKGFEVIVSQSVRGFIMWSIYETRIDKLKALGDSLFDTLSAYVETMTSDSAIRVASRFIQRSVEK